MAVVAASHDTKSTSVCTLNLHASKKLVELADKPGHLQGRDADVFGQLFTKASLTMRFDPEYATEFVQSCHVGHTESVRRFIQAGQAPDLQGRETDFGLGYLSLTVLGAQRVSAGPRPLDHQGTIRLLIENGAPLNQQDLAGYTALHHSTHNAPRLDLARILLEAGASPNTQNKCGFTPLHSALAQGHFKSVEVLMEHGADIDIPDPTGMSVRVMYPATGPQGVAIIEKWLRKRNNEGPLPDLKACNTCGKKAAVDTPLRFCSRCGLVKYCSTQCQRADWSAHKTQCKSTKDEESVTIKPYYRDGTALPLANNIRAAMAMDSQGVNVTNNAAKKIKPLAAKDDMTIKVALPLGSPYGDMMVYNNKRTLQCFIRQNDNPKAYAKIQSTIHEKGVKGPGMSYGVKAYFKATLENRDKLKIRTDAVLAPQPF